MDENMINIDEEVMEDDMEDIDTGMSGAKVGLLALGGLAIAGAVGGLLKKRRQNKLSNPPMADAPTSDDSEE